MEAVTSLALSFKIQHAAEKGLAKLRKYSIPAKLHHAYIVGTGTFLYQSQSLICMTLRTPSFLASACSFQQPMTATSANTILKHTPLEELADELDRYLRFVSALVEQPDNGEPSAEEMLLNLLLWWKVSMLFFMFFVTYTYFH